MLNRILFVIGLLFSLVLVWNTTQRTAPAGFAVRHNIHNDAPPIYETFFASNAITNEVHSAGVVELSNGNIRAVWYGGTREGHADVAIYTNVWDTTSNKWGREQIAVDVQTTQAGTDRYTRKLGNPVIARGPDNNLWLFYVSAAGGWATSSVNLSISVDEGESWGVPKRLTSSPFLNLSTLVKGNPIHFSDGTVGLPVYHEFLAKFGELLRLDTKGNVIDKTRLSWGRDSLQPVIMPYSESRAISLMRYAGGPPNRILAQYSHNSGLSWTTPFKTGLPNPNAAITGISINGGRQLLIVFNNDPNERDHLSLAVSSDQGATWKIIHEFERWNPSWEGGKQGYSYPSLIQTEKGDFHLVYSWNVHKIKHVHFNQAWLESKYP